MHRQEAPHILLHLQKGKGGAENVELGIKPTNYD